MKNCYNIYKKNLNNGDLKYIGRVEGNSLVDGFDSFKKSAEYNKKFHYVLIPNETVALGSMWEYVIENNKLKKI